MTSHLGIGTRIRVRLHTVLTKGFLILFLYWKSSFTSKAQGYFLKTHTSSRLWYHSKCLETGVMVLRWLHSTCRTRRGCGLFDKRATSG
ncbi:uncharacterized protein [Lolium perenne]|uniref:uncharacterized protein isoform X2 n=1 Tax=Lolium perenne TaxID=4522 RepID=UPI003A99B3DC